MARKPLSGVRVLELGALIAGPFCAKLLAAFGTDVVKIEPPGQGDPLRKWRYLKDGTSLSWRSYAARASSPSIACRGTRLDCFGTGPTERSGRRALTGRA